MMGGRTQDSHLSLSLEIRGGYGRSSEKGVNTPSISESC